MGARFSNVRRRSGKKRPFRFGCLAVGWLSRLFVSPAVYRTMEHDRELERELERALRDHESKLPPYLPRGEQRTTRFHHRGRAFSIQSVCGGSTRLETRVYLS